MKFEANKWGFIGGERQDGESDTDTLMREVKEETGLDVLNTEHFNAYRVHFEAGDERRIANLNAFLCDVDSDTVRLDFESSEFKWLNLHAGKQLDLIKGNDAILKDLNGLLTT
jgi:8-oxo-dGTP pyrophosphatase MutT (NUDIX family)